MMAYSAEEDATDEEVLASVRESWGTKGIDTIDTHDILLVGSGCSALYFALNAPRDRRITLITKADFESSNSYLAQGGICVLRDESDRESFFEDTLKAGHYENDEASVRIMIDSSRAVIEDLIRYGVDFARNEDGSLVYTREGGHSAHRILYHADTTGREISSKLFEQVKQLPNVTLVEHTRLVDLVTRGNECLGAVIEDREGKLRVISARIMVLATGGIGGLFKHSSNFPQLTGDGLAIALRHGIETEHANYVQIHPTTLYTEKNADRSFLISEAVRGEGALLYGKDGKRFVDELLPRDILAAAIKEQMEKDGRPFVWEDLRPIPVEVLERHFPTIMERCLEEGYDVRKECIPVVPAQHYFMGGIKVDHQSRTSMTRLYAIGECACNGVHGRNRLASNSLLEALVFAQRAARDLATCSSDQGEALDPATLQDLVNLTDYQDREAYEKEGVERIMEKIQELGGFTSIDIPYKNKYLR